MYQLKHGLTVDGKTHKSFTIKTLTLGAELAVLDNIEVLDKRPSFAAQGLVEATEFMAAQVEFEGLTISGELLRQELTSDDFTVMTDAIEEYRKKS